jgi:Outer membrane protein beta-barrel domain/Phosphate-selective porin O and P
MRMTRLAAAIAAAFLAHGAVAADASVEQKLEILQKELDELRAEVARLKTQQAAPQAASASESAAASAPPSATPGTMGGLAAGSNTFGGYGELHYNNFRDGDKKDEIDFHRFVLFYGHKFNDRLRFYSELEVEHALVEGGEGALELEQAFLDYRFNDAVNLKVGAFLIPIGILNETHEPPTFFGVERNEVESRIIPSTWREAGVGVNGEIFQGLRYDVGITSSLDAGKFGEPEKGIREMRTELREAAAHDFAFYGALNYRGIPGLAIGTGVFTGNTGQNGASDPALKNVNARLLLWDVHAQYRLGGLELRALYARGSLNDADKITAAAIAREGDASLVAPKTFWGYYAEAGYHFRLGDEMELAPFARYERYNTQASVASGFSADPKNNERVTTVGVNFKLHPQVVFKADYQNFKEDSKKDRFNLGVGYMF